MAAKEKPIEVGVVEAAPEAQAVVAYYYLSSMNPMGAFYPGVPLADIHTDQLKTYPKWIQKSIKGSPMYQSASVEKEDGEGDNP